MTRTPAAFCLLSLVQLACSSPHAAPSEAERTPALQPAAADAPAARGFDPKLPDVERDRLGYLFDAAELVARTWPRLVADEVCILLLGRAAQWVVHCDRAPAGFVQTGQQFRGRPVFGHAGDRFEVSGETRTTAQLLAQTPAAAHVFGLSRRAAGLAPAYPWLLIGTLDALREYHPAFPPATTEHWLSVAIHELVHIHQLRQPSVQPYVERIDSRALHPGPLTAQFEQDASFRATIVREYQQLVAAATGGSDRESARRALRAWLRSYQQRSLRLAKQPDGAKLLHDERLFTYLEGVARFAESDFLVNDAQHPQAGLSADPQFHRFGAFERGAYASSPNRQLDPQYYYAIGYHLCVLLARIDGSWPRQVDSEPGWLIGLVARLAK